MNILSWARSSAAVTLLLLLLPAPPAQSSGAQKSLPYNVILLTADQMRADYMHTYGYQSPDTPNIDRLAGKGVTFTRMYAGAPWTTPSFGTILTGLFPTVHGMTLPPYEGCGTSISRPLTTGSIPAVPPILLLSPEKPIIPELLKRHGAITALDNANCWSIWDVVHRGWDSFKFFPGYQLPVPGHPGSSSFYLTAPQTTAWAEQWLKEHRGQRFFFWIHYMEPHAPFNEPAEYDRFKENGSYPNLTDGPELHRLCKLHNMRAIRRMQGLYAGKILYADHYIGKLLDTVRALGLDKNTIIIFTSDHGQLLYSHPQDFNTADHRSLYNADLHIPLIVIGPGIPGGKRAGDLASNYDILPTIMDLENLPPPSRTDGLSLKLVMKGTSPRSSNRYLYAEESNLVPQYSVRNDRYKLVETMPTGTIQCFDEAADRRELHDICAQIPREAAELKSVLDAHIQSMIEQAKSYSDWKNNLALAVLEQRDSDALSTLSLGSLTVTPPGGPHYQLTGRGWSMDHSANNFNRFAYWALPGPADASVMWRSDTPFIGNYKISIWYGSIDQSGVKQATDADYTVYCKSGSLSFPVNQTQGRGEWHELGTFQDPSYVKLTNRADGAIVAGAVKFVKLK